MIEDYMGPTADHAGSNSERQSVGLPGHCMACAQHGHVLAHPRLGCGDVGCTSAHDEPPIDFDRNAITFRVEVPGPVEPRPEPERHPGDTDRTRTHRAAVAASLNDDYARGVFEEYAADAVGRSRFMYPDLADEIDVILYQTILAETAGTCDVVECDPGRSAAAAVEAVRKVLVQPVVLVNLPGTMT